MYWLFKDPVVIMKEIMSWLFKDPIVTVLWLNFDHPNQKVKNGLKAKKNKLLQMKFFLKKQLLKFSLYLLAPFTLQNLTHIIRANPE